MIHYQFEAIHHLLDVNGRVGRLITTLLLYAWNLLPLPLHYLSTYFEANRQEYYARLLAVNQLRKWEDWLHFFMMGVNTQSVDAIQRITQLRML